MNFSLKYNSMRSVWGISVSCLLPSSLRAFHSRGLSLTNALFSAKQSYLSPDVFAFSTKRVQGVMFCFLFFSKHLSIKPGLRGGKVNKSGFLTAKAQYLSNICTNQRQSTSRVMTLFIGTSDTSPKNCFSNKRECWSDRDQRIRRN